MKLSTALLLIISISALLNLSQCYTNNGSILNPSDVLQKFFGHCSQKSELIKCLKIQALKVTERALHIKSFSVINGLDIVDNERHGKSAVLSFNSSKLEKLPDDDLDTLLGERVTRFLDTHKVEFNLPKIIDETGRSLSSNEARGKGHHHKDGGYGPLLAALAIKGSFLALAYKGIAIMSGTAILIGKLALLLTAILGLKKLLASNQEKTTFEIIKTPKYSEDHVHSTTYEDDHHDHYRRNYLDNPESHKRVYRFHIPAN